ncbi:sulfonate ABC transporter ATP-binding protein [Sphingomonas oleivorans]|uniref:Sulfonate ABC transporter ATP-binding protein n=1 Tax=Sphingomonas oleivorans TaxID=1735121 RepID=A0A2T5FTN2_9SPHN|nr:ABC transporter ATP-binding protein [Sphingomonas oleivorans]PTQ07425.1 sulfonate ABC transporter ATP-binding protein [Sphingomonas oleivorans]
MDARVAASASTEFRPVTTTFAADPRQPDPVVRLRGFTRRFGANVIIDGLDLDIAPGEFVALLGRSGSGKTTLLRTLAGLDDIGGQDVTIPGSRAVVFQDARLLPWKRIWRNVALGLGGSDIRARAEAALREVGLGHRLEAWPLTLSGGEAQRAALARALVREPQLLLLDEPFAALDALTRIKMHELVLSLWRTHRPAVLMVTHDVEEAMALADRLLVLDHGRIVAEERITAERGQRTAVARPLRARLLGHLGVDAPEGAYADLIAFPGAAR